MPEHITRTTQLTVLPKDDATYSELATTITITDESAGEFVVVEQSNDDYGKIAIKRLWKDRNKPRRMAKSSCGYQQDD